MNSGEPSTSYGYRPSTKAYSLFLAKETEVRHGPFDDHETELVKELHLIVNPPVHAALFVKFLRATRELLDLNAGRIAGSYEAGCSLTMYPRNPALLKALLNKLGEICEIEMVEYGEVAQRSYTDILSKLVAAEEPKGKQTRTIFVNLTND